MRTALVILFHLSFVVGSVFGQNPIASFSASNNQGCASLSVQFTNSSTNYQTSKWYFGDGTTSTTKNPSHVYSAAGSYTVSLVVTSSSGIKDSIGIANIVNVIAKPLANFASNQNQACEGNNLFTFLNQSLNYDSCVWDFGDGSISYLTSPQHTYSNAGTYTVKLVVFNSSYNCSDVLTRNAYIVVRPKPVVTFSVDTNETCDSLYQFQYSAPTAGLASWVWDFGDGITSSAANPSHVYAKSGSYSVTFIGFTAYGCSDTLTRAQYIQVRSNPVPPINLSDSGGCAPFTAQFQTSSSGVASYLWNFGNGATSSVQNPTYKYNATGQYNVSLNVQYNNGCANTNTFVAVQVDQTPSPAFTLSSFTGCNPFTPTITNTTAGVYDWLWDFGDGTTSDLHSPSHTWLYGGTYSVNLTASYNSGCQAKYSFPFQVIVRGPNANFTVNNTSGCPPLAVNFINQTQGSNTWYWDFGDGTTSSSANPSHIYQNVGTYFPMLIATDGSGCSDTTVFSSGINVSIPVSNFPTPDPVFACAPFSIQLSDNGGGANAWLWDFGDGTTSNLSSPTHTYTQPGTYTVSLATQSNVGYCAQNISNYAQFIIGGGKADFSFVQSWCRPFTAVFTDSSTNAVAWLWDFGDGNTSNVQHPTHVYQDPGFYDVKLTITSADGCTSTKTHRFAVNFMPLLANASAVTNDSVPPMTVNFAANSLGATGWLWDFGDGNTSGLENPVHTYLVPGPYNITLTIFNDTCTRTYSYGSTTVSSGTMPLTTGTVDTVRYSPIEGGCSPYTIHFNNPILNTVNITWIFGDSTTSNVDNPIHTYTSPGSYNLSIAYELSNGTKDTFFHPDPVIVVAPITDFAISQSGGCTGNSVAVSVNDGAPVSFLWNFGDSTTSNLANPVHTYTNASSNYTVSLLVTDTFGCGNYIVKTIYNQQNSNPTSSSTDRACVGDTIWFASTGSSYSGYVWHFGDGDSALTANPYHIYSDSGLYQVTMMAVDSQNCKKMFSLSTLIEVFDPQAYFQKSWTTSNCTRVTQQFKNYSSGYSSVLWDFGDGTTSTQIDPLHHYYNPGNYTVTLTVFGNNCSDTYIINDAVIFPNTSVDFTFSQDRMCLPITVTFTDLSVDATSYLWEFGDGTTSDQSNPVHVYTSVPNGDINLTITDTNGCQKFKSEPKILALKNAFGYSTGEGCNPLTVQFTDTTSNAVSLFWNFGDGDTISGSSPVHVYNQNGVYDVQLIATASDGCVDTLSIDSAITVSIPTADFVINKNSGCKPILVGLMDQSDRATKWLWNFGDGSSSVIANPTHLYDSAGVYDITLIVEDALGCKDTMFVPAAVIAKGPSAAFSMGFDAQCTSTTLN
ncbi:MAG: PKD domain-containing protein, partial [Bacteroidia bacterium]|nr:PKD domain-containing protein [Bacteroidia bacterium]